MNNQIINNREDLDLLKNTSKYSEFMDVLKGSIYRLEKDDNQKTWASVQDLSSIEKFGFMLADFPDVMPPQLPEYIPSTPTGPQVVTMRQARLALQAAGILGNVNALISQIPGPDGDSIRIEWEYAQQVYRNSKILTLMQIPQAQIDELFSMASRL